MKKKNKALSILLSAMLCTTAIPAMTANASTVLTTGSGQVIDSGGRDQIKGTEGGYSYELWNQSNQGTATMKLGSGGAFSCEWNGIENVLGRRGVDFDCTKTYQEIGNISIDYECDFRPDGNCYLCVYGWTRSPLVEYYIVEAWGDWRPPGGGYIATETIDGAQYDIYKTIRENQPSIDGNTTFPQYWSVRKEKRTSGTINVSSHFAAWEKNGLQMGKLYEVALNAEGYRSNGKANITKNIVTVGGEVQIPTEAPPKEPDANGYYFHSTFESDKDGWSARGNDKTDLSTKEANAGKGSLYVSGRQQEWNGAGYSLDSSTFKAGESYSFSTMAMTAEAATTFKLSLQYSLNGEDNYDSIAEVDAAKGQWVQLANTNYTIPAGASNLLLYVETTDGTMDFYMDEAIGAVKGTKISGNATGPVTTDPVTTDPVQPPVGDVIYGDVNQDGVVDIFDVGAAKRYLFNIFKGESIKDKNVALAADVNGDGTFSLVDVVAIHKFVIKQITAFERVEVKPTDPPTTEPPVTPTNPPVDSGSYMQSVRAMMVENEPAAVDQMQAGADYGKYEKKSYFASACNRTKSVNILLPPGYDSSNESYPVLYLLHGIFGNEDSMKDSAMHVQAIAGNLAKSGDAEKMIIVMPDMFSGASAQPGGFDTTTTAGYDNFSNEIVKDLMPFIEQNYRVKTGRDNTAITGFSMGGREGLYIGYCHQDVFGYVGGACPAPGITPGADNFMQHPGCIQESEFKFSDPYPYVIMISAAKNDGVVGNFPESYHNILTRNGSDHIWHVVNNGGHDGVTVSAHLYNFLRCVFRAS